MSAGIRTASLGVGQCCCHSKPTCIPANAPVITMSNDCFFEGAGAARISDIVRNGCGHIGVIVTGSGTVTVNGLPGSFIGARTVGCVLTTIITGAPSVDIGA